MDKVRLGIIGIGNMGSTHFKAIALEGKCPEIELTAVCDISNERIEWAKGQLGDNDSVKFFSDAEELMKSGLVDAIYIATPHYDHPVLAKLAFGYGIHVITEKPAGVYTKAVREANEAAKKAGVVYGIMFQQRTVPAFRKVKELLSSGQFGQIRGVYWVATNWYRSQFYYDSGSWRATWAGEGGGVLLNQCPHNLDLLQWLVGLPEEITASCKIAQWHDVEIEDDVVAMMKFKNGAHGTFIASTGMAPGTNRLEISTDGGTILVENYTKLTVRQLTMLEQDYSKTIKSVFDNPKITTINYDFDEKEEEGIHYVMNKFASAILHGTELVARGEEGINSLMLSNAMYLSDWTNAPVKLPIDEDLFYAELQKRIKTSKHKEVKAVFGDTEGSYHGVKTK